MLRKSFLLLLLVAAGLCQALHAQPCAEAIQTNFSSSGEAICRGDSTIIRVLNTDVYTSFEWVADETDEVISTADSVVLHNIPSDWTFPVFGFSGLPIELTASGPSCGPNTKDFTFQVFDNPEEQLDSLFLKCQNETLTLSVSISNNQTVTWDNGSTDTSRTFSTGGNYWVRVTNAGQAAQCATTDFFEIRDAEPPAINLPEQIRICNGDSLQLDPNLSNNSEPPLIWEWSPNRHIDDSSRQKPVVAPPSTTTYRLRVTNGGGKGCSVVDSVRVVVPPPLDFDLSPRQLTSCSGAPVQLSLSNLSGGFPGPGGYDIQWAANNSSPISDPQSANPSVTPQDTSVFIVTVTDSLGCRKRDSVIINPTDFAAHIENQQDTLQACVTQSQPIAAGPVGSFTPPLSYSWQPANLFTSQGDTATFLSNAVGPQNISVTIRDANGCQASRSTVVDVRPKPSIEVFAVRDSLCPGGGTRLWAESSSGEALSNFRWEADSGQVVGSGDTVLFSAGIEPGAYEIRASARNSLGCRSNPTPVQIQVLQGPRLGIDVPSTKVCPGTPITLEAQPTFDGNFTYAWIETSRPQDTIGREKTLSVSADGTYRAFAKDPSLECRVVSEVDVTFKNIQKPTFARIVPLTLNCDDSTARLSFQTDGSDLTNVRWSTTGKQGNVQFEMGDPFAVYRFAPNDSGPIQFGVTVFNECGLAVDTAAVNTIVRPNARATLKIQGETETTNPSTFFADQTAVFSQNSLRAVETRWEFDDGSLPVLNQDRVTKQFAPGSYQVLFQAISEDQCRDTVRFEFEVTDRNNRVFVPNVLSPQAKSPDNRHARVYGNNLTGNDFSYSIYNKWGQRVYHTENLTEATESGWDGSDGNEIILGTYLYSVSGTYLNGDTFEQTGHINVIR